MYTHTHAHTQGEKTNKCNSGRDMKAKLKSKGKQHVNAKY